MSLELFYSKKCPKSREILLQILGSNIRHNFVLISIDKHLQTKRKMPKGIRITPTVHREALTQIDVYEGDDILTLINQLKSVSPTGPQGPMGHDFINPTGPMDSIKPAGSNIKNRPKIQEDESWKTSTDGNLRFEVKDTGPKVNLSAESLKAQRDEVDKQIAERLEAAKNDVNLQKWIQGVQI